MTLHITEVEATPEEYLPADVSPLSAGGLAANKMTRRGFLRAAAIGGVLAVSARLLPPLPSFSQPQIANASHCSNTCR